MILLEIYEWKVAPGEIDDDEDREMIEDGPVLAFCTKNPTGRYITVQIIKGKLRDGKNPGYVARDEGDEFVVVPEDMWSEVAKVASATRALTGRWPE